MQKKVKRLLEVYFSILARIKERYSFQKNMRTNFSGRYVVRSDHIGHLFLDTTAYEADRLAKFGEMEPQLHHIFRTFIAAHSIVLDIGANSGFHSLLFSTIQRNKEKAGGNGGDDRPGGKVYAFEPVPFNYRSLCRNLALQEDSNVVPVNLAVSDTSGMAEMFALPEGYYWHGCHSLVKNEKLSGIHSEAVELLEIQTVSIDNFLSERDEQLPVSFMKIDVEGAEAKVLRSAMKTIHRDKPVLVIEFAPSRVQFLKTPADAFEDLTEIGYRAFAIFKDGSMSKIDSISDYVKMGTVTGDAAAHRAVGRSKSGEMLLIPAERLELNV